MYTLTKDILERSQQHSLGLPKLEPSQMSSSRMERDIVHSYNGILHGNENEQSTTPCTCVDESHKHNVEWKKPGTKEYLQYDSIYKEYKCRQNHCVL